MLPSSLPDPSFAPPFALVLTFVIGFALIRFVAVIVFATMFASAPSFKTFTIAFETFV